MSALIILFREIKMLNKKYLFIGLALSVNTPLYAVSLSSHLQSLQADYQRQIGNNSTGKTFVPTDTTAAVVEGNQVVVTLVIDEKNAKTVISDLKAKGMTNISQYKHLLSGSFPIKRLNELNSVANVKSITSSKFIINSHPGGYAYNAADTAMYTDYIKKTDDVDGTGVTVGVISDSYNCLTGAATDVASGDLPDDVKVIKEYADCTKGTDEGRAMMQVIHDIAPGAKLLFYTAGNSPVEMANAIRELQKAGANVIVDDVYYLESPMFQDGPIAQAVDEITGKRVVYLSSAGNRARLSYENKFVSSKIDGVPTITPDNPHDFGKAAGQTSDPYQHITIPKGTTAKFVLQWDDPSIIAGGAGAKTDLDMFLLDKNKKRIAASSQEGNKGKDAVEYMEYTVPNTEDAATEFYLYIAHRAGPAPTYLKYVIFAPTGVDTDAVIPQQVRYDSNDFKFYFKNGTATPDGDFYAVVYSKRLGKNIAVKVSPDPLIYMVRITEQNATTSLDYTYRGFSYDNNKYRIDDGTAVVGGEKSRTPVLFVPKGYEYLVTSDSQMLLYPEGTNIEYTTIDQYDTKSSTIYGHSNAVGAISVGAISYQQTPWFSGDYKIESFSSAGGTPILFDKTGNRLKDAAGLPITEMRLKPEVIAPDDIDTTFFPAGPITATDTDNNGLPNFKGTSAAAPNAAGMIALLLQKNPFLSYSPSKIKDALMNSALPLSDDVQNTSKCLFNWDSGCGLIQADQFFLKAADISLGVYASFIASKSSLKAKSDSMDYTLSLANQTKTALTNVKIIATQVPQNTTFGTVTGCTSFTANSTTFTCDIASIAAKANVNVKVPISITNNPNTSLKFAVNVTGNGIITPPIIDAVETPIEPLVVITPEDLAADLDGDGCIDKRDYGILFGVFRTASSYNVKYDLNADGKINLADLKLMATKYSIPNGLSCS